MRKKTREISIGNLKIGGENPILIQSMTNVPTADAAAVIAQLQRLETAGAQLVRLAFSSPEECRLIPSFKRETHVPLIADIQFDYRLALAAMDGGIDKIRFNPGNIGDDDRVRTVLKAAAEHRIPIRIGVNSGSVPKDILSREGALSDKLVAACMRHVRLCEENGFFDLVLSVKSSSVPVTVAAYRTLSELTDYPLHLGVTEAGTERRAVTKSAAAFGALLLDGIGDTVRVSITGDPVAEIAASSEILAAVGARQDFCEIVSCPTCSRTHIDLIPLVEAVEARYGALRRPLKLAVMGCAVNGPGEAADADYGLAGGDGCGVIFEKGKIVARVAEPELLGEFFKIIDKHLGETDDKVTGRNQ